MNVIVTGAGKGIGHEIVKVFARGTNHNIIAIFRNKDDEKFIREIKISDECNLIPYRLDITDASGIELLSKEISRINFKADILINNAGMMIKKPLEELNDKDFDDLFAINVKAPFRLVRMLLPYFQKKAHVVNISSMGGYQGSQKFSGMSLYSASKGALAVLSECLAEEFKSVNITVNCLCLGSVNTGMFTKTFPGFQASVSPKEIAAYIADFAINGPNYFNGKVIPVSVSTP